MKKIISIICFLFILMFFSSCKDFYMINMKIDEMTLKVGDVVQIDEELIDLIGLTNDDLNITSSDENIIKVNGNESFEVVGEGLATIKIETEKIAGFEGFIEITCLTAMIDPISIVIDYENYQEKLIVKDEFIPKFTITPDNAYIISYEVLTTDTLKKEGTKIICIKEGTGKIKVSISLNDELIQTKEYSYTIESNLRNIKYELNGGSIDSTYQTSYELGSEYILPIPTKAGYDFLGWSKVKNGTTYITKITKDDNTNITVYANFQKQAVISKITYIMNGGTCETCCAESYEEGVEITLCEAIKQGYNFLGWKLNGQMVTKISKNQTGDITLEAIFEKIFDGSEMVYILNGGSWCWETGTVTNSAKGIDADSNLPEIFMDDFYYYLKTNNLLKSELVDETIRTKGQTYVGFTTKQSDPVALYNNNSKNTFGVNDGYNQFFWDSIVDNKPVGGFFGTSPYKEKYAGLFDAVYPFIAVKYSTASGEKLEPAFSFILDGYFYGTQGLMSGNDAFNNFRSKIVECPNTLITNITEETTLPLPIKVGYAFLGWYEQADFSGSPLTKVSTNKKLYAKWYDLSYVAPSHKITYNLDGGTVNAVESLSEEDEYILPIPTKDGYRFLGWSETKGSTTYITKISVGNKKDIVLYANFEEAEEGVYRITYVYDAGELPTKIASSKQEFMEAFWNEFYKWSGVSETLAAFKQNCFTAWGKGTDYAKAKVYLKSGNGVIDENYFVNAKANSRWMDWLNVFESVVKEINGAQNVWEQGDYVGHIRLDDFFNKTENKTVSYWTAARIKKVYEGYPISIPLIEKCKDGSNTDLVNLVINDGRTFLGWYDSLEGGNKITNTSSITKDITLYARWSASTPVESLEVTNKITSIEKFKTHQLNISFTPTNATNKKVEYVSSNSSIISVSETGLLTGLKTGTVTITVKCLDNEKHNVSFDVKCYIDPFIDPDVEKSVLAPGEITNITYTLYQLNGCKVLFESSDKSVLTVDSTGQVQALKEGYAEITLKIENSENIKQVVGITVLNPNDKVSNYLGQAHNTDIHVKRNLNVAYAYLTDVYVSASDLLFNRDYTVNRTYESVQSANSSNHGGKKASTEFICVHYTAGTPSSSTAAANASYMSNSNSVSIHYTTGNDGIFSCLDDSLVAWHAGDGTGTKFTWTNTGVKAPTTGDLKPVWGAVKNSASSSGYYFTLNGQATTITVPLNGTTSSGNATSIKDDPNKHFSYFGLAWKVVNGNYYMGTTWVCFTQNASGVIVSHGGNNNSIGIETACNKGSDLWLTYQITAQLVSRLMKENSLGIERVVGHNFFSGKDCPQTLLASNGELWEIFMECVQAEYNRYTEYGNYEITCKSDNKSIMSDNARINSIPNYSTSVKYTLTINDGTTQKTITFSSIVHGKYTE